MATGTILIVLYNKKVSESSTYKSLLKDANSLKNIDLLIWNNGPQEVNKILDERDTEQFRSITILEDLSNAGLAKIYNFALTFKDNDFCVFLDDDSAVSAAYIKSLLTLDRNTCAVPILTHNGLVQSPELDKKKAESLEVPNHISRFRAAGSGIAVGADVANKIKATYGSVFDEHFLLYGVDTTFFIRLERANLISYIKIIPGFEHSFSRLSDESDTMSDFRQKERAYDAGLKARYYKSKPSLLVYTIRTGLRSIKNRFMGKKDLDCYKFKAIVTGKHYRDN